MILAIRVIDGTLAITQVTDGILATILVTNPIREEMKSNSKDNTEMKPNNTTIVLKIPAEMQENASRKEQEELLTLHAALHMEQ